MNLDIDDFEHIENLIAKHPQISKNQLRWIVANKERYGLSHAIKRIGKRIYFHMPTFVEWMHTRNA